MRYKNYNRTLRRFVKLNLLDGVKYLIDHKLVDNIPDYEAGGDDVGQINDSMRYCNSVFKNPVMVTHIRVYPDKSESLHIKRNGAVIIHTKIEK